MKAFRNITDFLMWLVFTGGAFSCFWAFLGDAPFTRFAWFAMAWGLLASADHAADRLSHSINAKE